MAKKKLMWVDLDFYEYCKRKKSKKKSMTSITKDLIPSRMNRTHRIGEIFRC